MFSSLWNYKLPVCYHDDITGLDNELIIIQLSGYYTSNDERKLDILS